MNDLTRQQFARLLRERTPCVDAAEQATSDHCIRERILREDLREAAS
jgi:hypothetical protein